MKHLFSATILLVIIVLSACNSSNKSSTDETYQYVEETYELNDILKQKIGDWAEEGVICYGLVVINNEDGSLKYGIPVKSKIVRIKMDSIKMKCLEDLNVGETSGCSQLGISYGQQWWETEGDLFKTREEAVAYLHENNLNAN